jgi:hypothetical protein
MWVSCGCWVVRNTTVLQETLFIHAFFGEGIVKGTLYVAPIIAEVSPKYSLKGKIRVLSKMLYPKRGNTLLSTSSTSVVESLSNSLDYIFVDPPFGRNLMYGELNFIWEAWLKVKTCREEEAIIDETQSKLSFDYQEAMRSCFSEMFRILKPGHWMTVEFHNSQSGVWNIIQESILNAGFVIADARLLDKKQITMQQWVGTNVVDKDLIISAYKPHIEFENTFQAHGGTAEGAWKFIRQHLAQLPVVAKKDGIIETLSERQAYLLFDRMIAFHIQRGTTIPLSASTFYAGLIERFPERDGMYFLPNQAPEYDRARLEADGIAQLSLFVKDEKSAIQWMRQLLTPQLGGQPQTYQDVQPKFLRQLHQVRHEAIPELSVLLEQNFLQDKTKHWYAPDPTKAGDLEKLRLKALLQEFKGYTESENRLRQFRTEAVRAGFSEAYKDRNWQVILKVADRLPVNVLQEDPDLLMYYDAAALRAE